jgi:hypothetical protein
MIGSFGAFNILQGSLVNIFSIYGKLNVSWFQNCMFSPKMKISLLKGVVAQMEAWWLLWRRGGSNGGMVALWRQGG